MLEINICFEKQEAFTFANAIPTKKKFMITIAKISDLGKTIGLFNTKVWTLLHGLAIKKISSVSYTHLTLPTNREV